MADSSRSSRWSAILLASALLLTCFLTIFVVVDHQPYQEWKHNVLVKILAGFYAACGLALLAEPSFGTGYTTIVACLSAILWSILILAFFLLSWDRSLLDKVFDKVFVTSSACVLANVGLAAAGLNHSARLRGYSLRRYNWGIATGVFVIILAYWALKIVTSPPRLVGYFR
jgi:hypothetical protein